MNVIPKKPFTWILVGVAIYAYATHHNESKLIAKQNAEKNNVKEEVVVDNKQKYQQQEELEKESIKVKSATAKDGVAGGAVNYIVKELSQTDTGKAFIRALADKSIKEKFGSNDISVIAATNENKIVIVEKLIGKGTEATCGSDVKINYDIISSKYDVKVDSTRDSNKPISLKIGEGSVIKGLENGVVGMKVGGSRKIAIPPYLAYGDPKYNNNLILQNSTILAEVELMEVKNGKEIKEDVNIIEVEKGRGDQTVLCDTGATVGYVTQSGKKGSFKFVAGENKVPYGVEKGILGMKLGQKRKLEIPYELMEFDNKDALKDLGVVEGKKFIIHVELKSFNNSNSSP